MGAPAEDEHDSLIVLHLNRWLNAARARLGFPYWSLALYLKQRIKNAVSYVSDFEHALALEARRRGFDSRCSCFSFSLNCSLRAAFVVAFGTASAAETGNCLVDALRTGRTAARLLFEVRLLFRKACLLLLLLVGLEG
jgi:hypothetical protein